MRAEDKTNHPHWGHQNGRGRLVVTHVLEGGFWYWYTLAIKIGGVVSAATLTLVKLLKWLALQH